MGGKCCQAKNDDDQSVQRTMMTLINHENQGPDDLSLHDFQVPLFSNLADDDSFHDIANRWDRSWSLLRDTFGSVDDFANLHRQNTNGWAQIQKSNRAVNNLCWDDKHRRWTFAETSIHHNIYFRQKELYDLIWAEDFFTQPVWRIIVEDMLGFEYSACPEGFRRRKLTSSSYTSDSSQTRFRKLVQKRKTRAYHPYPKNYTGNTGYMRDHQEKRAAEKYRRLYGAMYQKKYR